jgi:hypothetical protein
MNSSRLFLLTAAAGLVGCQLDSQTLPYDVEAVVTRSIPAQGGFVSTPAGASVHFPEGSLGGGAQVTLAPAMPAAPLQALGTVASRSFAVDAGPAALVSPATLELRLTTSVDPKRLWLASIVSFDGGRPHTYGNSRVDLNAGVISGRIRTLGVLTAVIPPAGAVTPVSTRASAAEIPGAGSGAASTGPAVQSVTAGCGGTEPPCTGLSAVASQSVLDLVEEAAILNPVISGGFQQAGGGAATGSVVATATLRVLLQGGNTAESIGVDALLETTPSSTFTDTPSEIIITDVRHRISGTEMQTGEDIATLVLPKNGATATVSIRRSFEIRAATGELTPADVTITYPLTIQ